MHDVDPDPGLEGHLVPDADVLEPWRQLMRPRMREESGVEIANPS